ncbi:MAG: DUF302 domain-containing protein [Brevundimonas sp.]|uniref:DUF302 domain-containing protein n=1 Tax=Brevundimonas sp. TaxID=1871086 RepID=UPI002726996E|nr:DUF302 domain-containing protein [Brevundimonas sp.]MDZ4322252.1 DUF302 domain-containing protein [Phenylobacterium sp.]MDO9588153.1 DUF302 domain-containing protein [Brevundimonas sp.]MDP3369328.1 DUF302 domain-containing protein [Brevundimonas sp.]MDP3655884.1 DUF302 domain-containing protein [Brevundimonas sp.]MDZ4108896.1 DUF302 domain-containing protein [Brevundimonas sp.]
MTYFHARTIEGDFDSVLERTRAALQKHGFGVLTEIDVQATLKAKIGEDFRPYRILGACNPMMAHQALMMEPHVGVMLPCNVVVQQVEGGVEVFAVDPAASMNAIDNPDLLKHARMVGAHLQSAVDEV